SKTVRTFAGARVDYLINKNNTLNVNYNYNSSEITNQEFAVRFGGGFGFGFGGAGGGGGGGFGGGGGGGGGGSGSGINTLATRASSIDTSNHNLRLTETWIINSNMIHETRFQYQRERRNQQADNNEVAINVDGAFLGGGATCCPSLNDTD